jgi:hypothetical protein
MTPEEFAGEVAAELAARNADMPHDAVLMLVQKTWPAGGPKIGPRETVDSWFQVGIAAPLTAAEWDAAADPAPMLRRVRFRGLTREFTLFGCGCCRRVWDLLLDEYRRAVEATERFARGEIGRAEWEAAFEVPQARMAGLVGPAREAAGAVLDLDEPGYYAAANPSLRAAEARAGSPDGPSYLAQRAAQADLLRSILGNPLRVG